MIDLLCLRCGATLPVAENKLGTRIFVCPICAHPLEVPGPRAGTATPPPAAIAKLDALDTSEDKTMAPDASLLYVQAKLREAKARRSGPEIQPAPQPPAKKEPSQTKPKRAAPVADKPRPRPLLLWGGIGFAAALAVGALVFVLSRGTKTRPTSPETSPSEETVQTQPDKLSPSPVPENQAASVAELAQIVKQGPAPRRKEALRELAGRGSEGRAALPAVLELLKDPDAELRTQARETLNRLGPATPADLPICAAALRDASPDVRIYAAGQLAGLGHQAKSELVFLRVLSLDENPAVQEAARKAAARIEEALLAGLIQGLQDKSAAVRGQSAQQLAEMGDNAKAALPSLVEALADGNSAVRLAAINAFVAIGPDAILVLGEALRDGNPRVRLTAINALGRMGADARFVLPELIACLGLDARSKEETLQALARIGDYAIPYLVQALEREKDRSKQKPVIDALERMGPSAGPVLQATLKNARPEAGKAAAEVLTKAQSQPPPPPRKDRTGDTGLIQSQLRAWFVANDANKDGFLDKDELAHAIRGRQARAYDYTPSGQKPRPFGSRDFRRYPDYAFLCRLDRDNDGKISRDEFERWAYDYADYLKRDMDERQRLAQAQARLMERNLSEAMRLQRESAVAQLWANYHAGLNLQGAVNRDIANMQWMQRWSLAHLPHR